MTIQLTRATYVSGVLEAAASQHTLDAATEAAFVSNGSATWVGDAPSAGGAVNPAFLTTDASGNTVLVGADGVPLLTMEEPSKNIIANVNHRTGTLGDSSTGLLSLSGGLGEISVDDALKGIALHTGVAGEARAIYRNGLVGMYGGSGSATNVPSGATGQPVKMMVSYVDPQGLLTATPSEFLTPATIDRPALIVVSGVARFGPGTDSGTGTVRSITLQFDATGSGDWVDVSDGFTTSSQNVTPTAGLSLLRFSFSGALYAVSAPVGTETAKFRLLVKQDSGAAMTVTVAQLNLAVYRD